MFSAIRAVALAFAVACGLVSHTEQAYAQDYPRKTIRIVVPYPAGSNSDHLARFFSQRLSARMGVPVIVDNRGGGGGTIGTQAVIASEPDGYTLLLHSGAIATEVVARKDLAYDMRKALAPITMLTLGPNVLLVNPALPVKTVAELVAYARANPGKLNFGSPGLSTSIHLSTELFKSMAGIDIVHIPYKGGAPSYQGLAGGEIQILIDPLPTARTLVASGKARPLAVTTAQRTELWPELATVAESGVPGYDAAVWFGLFAPAATPADIQARVNTEIRAVLAEPESRDWLTRQGSIAVGDTQAQFRQKIDADIERWRRLVQSAGIKFD